MADVETRFKKFLEADSTGVAKYAGDRVHNDHVPQREPKPYVWYQRRLTDQLPTLDSAAGEAPQEFQFDVECVAKTIREAKLLAESLRTRCHCYRGPFDDSTVQGIFVTEQSSDYIPLGIGDGSGPFEVALSVQVFV